MGLGKRFTSQVRETISYIQQNPFAVAVRYNNVRTAVLEAFPYMVHYSIYEIKEKIIVFAVLHTSRDPEIWDD